MKDASKNDPMNTEEKFLYGNIEIDEIDTDRISFESSVLVDYERFAHYLDGCEASEDDKRKFAQLIWNIMYSFASLRFGRHPIQTVQKICGKTAFSSAAGGRASR